MFLRTFLTTRVFVFICALATISSPALADCTPANDLVGPHMRATWIEGGLVYDTTNDVLKTCDGTNYTTVGGASLSGGTAGYLGVWTGASSLGKSGTSVGQQLYWDTTNHRLGIGTTTPANKLDVGGTVQADYLRLDPQDGTNEGGELQLAGAGSNGTVQMDNFAGNVRLHTLASGKQFQVIGGGLSADGSATVGGNVSVSGTAFLGWERVTASTGTSSVATCSAGKQVVGGGCLITAWDTSWGTGGYRCEMNYFGTPIYGVASGYPSSATQWSCGCPAGATPNGSITAYAICMRVGS